MKHKYTSAPSDYHHSSKRSSPYPSSLLTSQTTTHYIYHTTYHLVQLIKPTKGIAHQSSSTLARQSFQTHHQHKPTFMHHTKNNNHTTKNTFTNTIQPPQHPSQNTRYKHNQTSYRLQHKHNQVDTIKPQHITTSINNIATKLRPVSLSFHKEINSAIMDLLLQRCKQSRNQSTHL